MNRFMIGSFLTLALVGSASAATSTPMPASTPTIKTASVAVTPVAECKTLKDQWNTAATTNSSNTSFGKAKTLAGKAEKNCSSPKATLERKGAVQYHSALKLIGVTPSI